MGRELKRVPLDFNWPMNKVWEGFLNPHYKATDCPHCEGTGSSPLARRLSDQWYGNAPFKPEDRGSKPLDENTPAVRRFAERNVKNAPLYYLSQVPRRLLAEYPTTEASVEDLLTYQHNQMEEAVKVEAIRLSELWNAQWSHHLNQFDVDALIKAERLWDFTRVPRTPEQVEIVKKKIADGGNSWLPEDSGYRPTPEEVNEWSIGGFGHDSINNWVCVRAECERLGDPCSCTHCDGEGVFWPSPEAKATYDNWKPKQPPKGKGYQLWETVTEGSPCSPVFARPEKLAAWLADNPSGVTEGTSFEQWMRFIVGPGWAPSFMMDASGFKNGVEAMADR
jgi:hypothetical protein